MMKVTLQEHASLFRSHFQLILNIIMKGIQTDLGELAKDAIRSFSASLSRAEQCAVSKEDLLFVDRMPC